MTYKEIIKIIKNISLALPDVESFYTGDVYEINKDQSVKYGSVVLTNQEHSFDNVNDQFNYNFVLFYIDRLTDDENNRIDVQTAGINALTTVVKTIEEYGCIIDNVRYNVFKERFNDWCSGVYGTFSIQVDDNDCVEEFEIITPEKLRAITINSNGTYKGLFNEVTVNVADKEFLTETKSISITENGTYSVEKSANVDGMSAVEINVQVPQPTFTTEELSVTANGEYTPTADGFSKVSVNVPTPEPNLQTKSISITENGTQTISADNGYDGLSSVSITTNVSGGTTSDKIVLIDGMKLNYTDRSIDYSKLDFSQVTDFGYMFAYSNINSALNIDTRNVTNMRYIFRGCYNLWYVENIANWDVRNVIYMNGFFYNCNEIYQAPDLSKWKLNNVIDMSDFFSGYRSDHGEINMCGLKFPMVGTMRRFWGTNAFAPYFKMDSSTVLPKINLTDWKFDYYNWDVTYIMYILNALPQLSSSETFTCTIGSANLAKLTDAQKSIATNKGWVLN